MNQTKRGGVPRELARARERFKSWRRTRRPKSRIPDRLWKLATKLAPVHGLHRTSSTLKLDYYSLKERLEAATRAQDATGPAFLELNQPVHVARECIIELEDDSGVSTRVHLKGYDASDIAAVGRSFWIAP